MEELHYWALQRLARCSFLPGSWDKRFVKNLSSLALEAELSEKQIIMLKKTAYKYRKQIAAIDPNFDFDWTFDCLDVALPRRKKSAADQHPARRERREVRRRQAQLVKRYGTEQPESIKDYWKK